MQDIFFSLSIGLGIMFAYGLSSPLSKPLVKRYGPPQAAYLRGLTVAFAALITAIPFIPGIHNWHMLPAAVALGIFGYFPLLSFFTALKKSPVGLVTPIAETSLLVIVLLSFSLLHLQIRPLQWLAIGLLIGASLTISLHPKHLSKRSAKLYAGIPFAVMTSLGWGVYFFLLVPIAKELGPWVTTAVTETSLLLTATAYLRLKNRLPKFRHALSKDAVVPGLLIFSGSLLFSIGSKYANPEIFIPPSQSTAVVATVAGMLLYRERLRTRERLATAVMCFGVLLLSFQ